MHTNMGAWCGLCLLLLAGPAFAEELMTDEAMDTVTARGLDVEDKGNGALAFGFDNMPGLVGVSGAGDLQLLAAGGETSNSSVINNGTVVLQGDAQKYLTALVNLNAANVEWLGVFVNLTINNNSTVGTVNQGNFAQLPVIP